MTASHDSCCTTSRGNDDPGSCCSPDKAAVLDELRNEEMPADVAAIRSAAFAMLLETGEPVSVANLTAATEIASERVMEIYRAAQVRGRSEFNDEGQLIGIAGLSLTPSPHQLIIGNTTRWTWCALDAVGILGALGATGSVRSRDPHTGDEIEIEFTNGAPDTEARLFILGGHDEGSVREEWCPRVNFFGTLEAAQAWVTVNDVEGDIVSVTEVAPDAAEIWRRVVDPDAAGDG